MVEQYDRSISSVSQMEGKQLEVNEVCAQGVTNLESELGQADTFVSERPSDEEVKSSSRAKD